jgi:hypothetical protein
MSPNGPHSAAHIDRADDADETSRRNKRACWGLTFGIRQPTIDDETADYKRRRPSQLARGDGIREVYSSLLNSPGG